MLQNDNSVNIRAKITKWANLMANLLEDRDLKYKSARDGRVITFTSHQRKVNRLGRLLTMIYQGENDNWYTEVLIDGQFITTNYAYYLINRLDYINTKIQNDKYKKYKLISGWILYIICVLSITFGGPWLSLIDKQLFGFPKMSKCKKIIKSLGYMALLLLNAWVNFIVIICIMNPAIICSSAAALIEFLIYLVIAVIFARINLFTAIRHTRENEEMLFPQTVFVAEYQNIKNFIQEYSGRVTNINLNDSISNAEIEMSENEKSENEKQIPNLDNGLNLSNEVVIFEIPSK